MSYISGTNCASLQTQENIVKVIRDKFNCITNNLYQVLLSPKRGTVSARNITLLIDYCVNYYCAWPFI